ncbi:MAG: SURF1 family protein [Brevundimonas sp.]|nr:MAG: SURF1 family protein [Brevundimonas sp.]
MTEARARFPWGLTVATGLALILLCGLGTWQGQRLQWKEGLIAESEAAAKAPPMDLRGLMGIPDREFRKVTLTCSGLDTAPYVELQTIHDGQPGVRLISLCFAETYLHAGEGHSHLLLVDRGFVPEGVSARPAQVLSDKPVEITAQFRTALPLNGMAPPPEGRRFFDRDVHAMTALLLEDHERLGGDRGHHAMRGEASLYALTSSNPEWTALQPSAPPAAFSNNHLGYALTWFGLALALAGTYVALLRRKLRPSTPEKSSS